MFAIGQGRFKLGKLKKEMICTDGVIYFRVFSPTLRHIMKRHKRDSSVTGKWLTFNNWLFWFKKAR